MKKVSIFLFVTLILLLIYSCNESKSDKITRLVNEWEGRNIIYPQQMFFTVMGKDTISSYPIFNTKFSIITYVDSVGCTSCKLQLQKWLDFIHELDSLTGSSVPIHFFLHPKYRNEVVAILKRSQFEYPVCIDEKDSLDLLNNFPEDMSFQTFLLDEEHKVISIGNPVLNPKIKDLYLNILLGEGDSAKIENTPITTIAISEKVINMGSFSWKDLKEKKIVLRNSGKSPLVITEILASCGCIITEYDKKPILPHDSTSVKIQYLAERPGYFNKTITIYCNAKDSPFKLRISGKAE